ncbi:MAG TPA: AtpZ/AtpI family protein [Vicinamibacterales bacterium]|nr:AtpZ/AtpI family protein [Vicinamibacterales bacterium]
MSSPWRRQHAETFRALGSVGAVGIAFVLALIIGFWVGHVLDTWLGTSPWFSILFFFFGLAAGVLNVYRTMAEAGGGGRREGEKKPGPRR